MIVLIRIKVIGSIDKDKGIESIDKDKGIGSIDKDKGHVYLGMSFLPTDNFDKILMFNINNRMKHIAKYYAWLEITENTPIETKLLVLDNCAMSALVYGCEAWGDLSCVETKLTSAEKKVLKRILNVRVELLTILYSMN